MRGGVTLVIPKGAILYTSSDPRLFDVKPGACGIVTESSRGCKPLLGGDRVQNAAVLGEGTIDGRGGEHLLGRQVSWWDLAQHAKVSNKNQNCPRLLVVTHRPRDGGSEGDQAGGAACRRAGGQGRAELAGRG